jgi:hypothetical protein
MRKVVLGLLAIALLGIGYYFISGSDKLVAQMQASLQKELTSLQSHGFAISEHQKDKREEHFILSIKEPHSVYQYLSSHGMKVTEQTLKNLKGSSFGVDVHYLPNTTDILALDLYPHTLSKTYLANLIDPSPKVLTQIEKLIQKKALLLHISMNKLLSKFHGNIQDINETITDKTTIQLLTKNVTFEGSLNKEKLETFTQTVEKMVLKEDNITIDLTKFYANYQEKETHYMIGLLSMHNETQASVNIRGLDGISSIEKHNKLLRSHSLVSVAQIHIQTPKTSYDLNQSELNTTVDNLNIDAFNKLQHTDPKDKAKIRTLTSQILASGIAFDIHNLTTKQIEIDKQIMGSYQLKASGSVDKNLALKKLEANPWALLKAVDAEATLAISPALFSTVMDDPKLLIILMLFPPKEEKGQKVFELGYHKGKIKVNGASF